MPYLDYPAHILRRTGLYSSRAEKSICFCGNGIAEFENATALMKEVRQAPTLNYLLLSSPDRRTCAWLRRRFTGSKVLPPPWGSGILVRRYFKRLDPVILFWIGLDERIPVEMLRPARRLGIPAIENGGSKTLEKLRPVLKRVPRRRQNSPNKRRLSLNFSQTRLGSWIASKRSARRIGSWDDLRDRLGNPQTIFCLGKGPSSEDPAVLDVQYDCLMRVNHRWLSRGVLTNPDMVHVGSLSTTLTVPACVFGFRSIRREQQILLRHLMWGLRFRQMEHFTLERVASDAYSHTRWSANPTNGAVMIATAVKLHPGRIVIGGKWSRSLNVL